MAVRRASLRQLSAPDPAETSPRVARDTNTETKISPQANMRLSVGGGFIDR